MLQACNFDCGIEHVPPVVQLTSGPDEDTPIDQKINLIKTLQTLEIMSSEFTLCFKPAVQHPTAKGLGLVEPGASGAPPAVPIELNGPTDPYSSRQAIHGTGLSKTGAEWRLGPPPSAGGGSHGLASTSNFTGASA